MAFKTDAVFCLILFSWLFITILSEGVVEGFHLQQKKMLKIQKGTDRWRESDNALRRREERIRRLDTQLIFQCGRHWAMIANEVA